MSDQTRPEGVAESCSSPAQIWSDLAPLHQLLCDEKTPESILLLKLDHVGDFCLALDSMIVLREAFPRARITLACAPWSVAIAEALGVADEIHPLRFFAARADEPSDAFDPVRLGPIANRHFDVAIDLRIDPDTRVVLDHVNARLRFGYDGYQGKHRLTVALPRPTAANADHTFNHQSLLMLRLAQTVIAVAGERGQAGARLRERCVPRALPPELATASRPIVALCTGSGRGAKDWPLDRFVRLSQWLIGKLGATVLLLGSADQAQDAARLRDSAPASNLIDMVGKTSLIDAIGLLGLCDLFIGNDTGLTHYAARLGTPTVAIFSGIDPTATWAPLGANVTVIRAPVPCSPCHILHLEDCRNGHACMESIPVEAVQTAIRRHLAKAVARTAPPGASSRTDLAPTA